MTDDEHIQTAAEGPILFRIAERVLNRPLLLHPAKAEIILHVLEGRLPLDAGLAPLSPEANRFLGKSSGLDGRDRKYRVQDSTAIIPVVGSLVNRGSWLGSNSGMTSYEGLAAQLRDAAADPEVSAVLLDIDSPGGEATGMFSLAEQVRQLGQTKPVTAFVNDMAASAAYGIASAANEIVVSPTSVVGSIGVVMTHMDRSKQMERNGVKPTLIYAGKHKVDGNPFGPLTETVQADLQLEVAKFYDQFVALVARGRTGMGEQAIRDTEARTYIGADAISRGLADRVASLDEVLSDLSATARGASYRRNGFAMSKPNEAAPLAENAGITPEAHETALAAARAEGAAAERARIASIMRSEAAEGREAQAMAFAFDTNVDAEAAIKVLSAAPKAAATGIPSIAARAAAETEMGADEQVLPNANEASASAVWSRVLGKIN